jgi:transcriptional regulator with XRE-family HTH domain
MRFAEAQAKSGLTDRELAERAGSSTRTVWRIKQGHLPRREGAMRRLAEALDVEIHQIDEFRAARNERALRAAGRRGAPEEVLDQAAMAGEVVEVELDDTVIRRAALRSVRDTMRYLIESGAGEEVDKVYRELRGEAARRKEQER